MAILRTLLVGFSVTAMFVTFVTTANLGQNTNPATASVAFFYYAVAQMTYFIVNVFGFETTRKYGTEKNEASGHWLFASLLTFSVTMDCIAVYHLNKCKKEGNAYSCGGPTLSGLSYDGIKGGIGFVLFLGLIQLALTALAGFLSRAGGSAGAMQHDAFAYASSPAATLPGNQGGAAAVPVGAYTAPVMNPSTVFPESQRYVG